MVGGLFVFEGQLGRVPVEVGLREAGRDAAEEHRFRERAGVPEMCGRLAGATDDCFGPIGPMVGAGDVGQLVVGELHFGEELRGRDVRDEQDAFGANDNRTLVGLALPLFFSGAAGVVDGGRGERFGGSDEGANLRRWAGVAVIPRDCDGFIGGEGGAGKDVADVGVDGPVPLVRGRPD